MSPALLMMLLATGPDPGVEEPSPTVHAEYVSGLAVGLVREQDLEGAPDLDGVRVSFVAFSRGRSSKYGFVGSWYAEWKESPRQEILEGGLEIAIPHFTFSRVGFGPRVRAAIQERAEPPHRGTDVVVGAGLEVGVWLSRRAQLALLADRSVGFEGGTRSSYSLNLRIILWGDGA